MYTRSALLPVLLLVACGGPQLEPAPAAVERPEPAKSSGARAELVRQATVKLDCPEAQLDFRPLAASGGGATTSYEVTGCGWITKYAYQDGKWVMTEGDAVSRSPPVDEADPGQTDPNL